MLLCVCACVHLIVKKAIWESDDKLRGRGHTECAGEHLVQRGEQLHCLRAMDTMEKMEIKCMDLRSTRSARCVRPSPASYEKQVSKRLQDWAGKGGDCILVFDASLLQLPLNLREFA